MATLHQIAGDGRADKTGRTGYKGWGSHGLNDHSVRGQNSRLRYGLATSGRSIYPDTSQWRQTLL
ncbi:hypothetical protein AA0616_1222 [Komagataeibacter nataicola NRIC 0616]|nr:hypothetical protein AA0616_1222 [Komagataeibacter nataicola NRIC 0616]